MHWNTENDTMNGHVQVTCYSVVPSHGNIMHIGNRRVRFTKLIYSKQIFYSEVFRRIWTRVNKICT